MRFECDVLITVGNRFGRCPAFVRLRPGRGASL